MSASSYKSSGVNIDAGNSLVDMIKPLAASTKRLGSMGSLGGFAGAFDLKALNYKDPIMLACTDGVGSKVKIAAEMGIYDGVGIDLVAMSVNDLVVQGAEPLFFLDYFATSHLDVDQASAVVASIADGCKQAGCALIGGETAEMPGIYTGKEFDMAGFAVGLVERDQVITGNKIAAGDRLIGLPSSGLHSNGFSLVRKVIADQGLSYHDAAPFDNSISLGKALLAPTKVYVKQCLAHAASLHGMAHITGGGFIDNLPRIVPDHLASYIDLSKIPALPLFSWLKQAGNIEALEMLRTFNCGIGMVVIAPEGVEIDGGIEIGRIVRRAPNADFVQFDGLDGFLR